MANKSKTYDVKVIVTMRIDADSDDAAVEAVYASLPHSENFELKDIDCLGSSIDFHEAQEL